MTYFNAAFSMNDYSYAVDSYNDLLQSGGTEFRRESIQINGMSGVRFYSTTTNSREPFASSIIITACCRVTTILQPNNHDHGSIKIESITQDLKSDLPIILKIHNSVKRL